MTWWKVLLVIVTIGDLGYLAHAIRIEVKEQRRKRWQTHEPPSHVEVIDE